MSFGARLREWFDIFFILILCFSVLLTTLLLQGVVLVGEGGGGMDYTIDPVTLLATIAILAIYFIVLFAVSNKEMKKKCK
jgi:hypothetical protein